MPVSLAATSEAATSAVGEAASRPGSTSAQPSTLRGSILLAACNGNQCDNHLPECKRYMHCQHARGSRLWRPTRCRNVCPLHAVASFSHPCSEHSPAAWPPANPTAAQARAAAGICRLRPAGQWRAAGAGQGGGGGGGAGVFGWGGWRRAALEGRLDKVNTSWQQGADHTDPSPHHT